jgi:hypothetical protein
MLSHPPSPQAILLCLSQLACKRRSHGGVDPKTARTPAAATLPVTPQDLRRSAPLGTWTATWRAWSRNQMAPGAFLENEDSNFRLTLVVGVGPLGRQPEFFATFLLIISGTI